MKSRKILIIAACWVIALLLFMRAYHATAEKPPAVSLPPAVIIPKQPDVPAHATTAAEKELEEKQVEQLKASLAKAVKNGNIPTPYPPVPVKDATGEPIKPK